MLRAVLLVLAVVGLHARPLQDVHRTKKSGWEIKGPQLVQDEHKEDSVHWKNREPSDLSKVMNVNTGVKHEKHESVPEELRRHETEPSRRFLMDLTSGMLKENPREMNRRVGGYYNPSAHEERQGTQNSRVTLVNHRTGQMLHPLTEMQRSAAQSKWEVISGSDHEETQDTSEHKSVPEELRRHGTEPSRRFLMDLTSGMLKENPREMNRRVDGYYNPSAHEERRGTQNSRVTLVNHRTGQMLYPLTEMQRSAARRIFRQDTEHESQYSAAGETHEHTEISDEMNTQKTEPSRNILIDVNAGQLKEHKNMMDSKAPGSKWEVISGSDHEETQDTSEHKSVPEELRRHGTEPSRRFLMDLTSGMLKENPREMNRRVDGYYNPSAHEERRGTQNSRVTLVNHRTGQMLYPLTEMQRSAARRIFRQNTEHESQYSAAGTAVAICQDEIIQGKCYSFNPTPQTFNEAEASCKQLSAEGHLASVPNADVHQKLVAMVTKAKNRPVLTWLGGIQKENQFEWIDGSAWGYSDWMTGHPQKHKPSCLEMFRIDESWWTAVDCGQQRAFICSYPMTT